MPSDTADARPLRLFKKCTLALKHLSRGVAILERSEGACQPECSVTYEIAVYGPGFKWLVGMHPFEAKALVMHGTVRIENGGGTQGYHGGDIFHLTEEARHREWFGVNGVRYLVGRRS